jgi:serine/threonine-protein kinase
VTDPLERLKAALADRYTIESEIGRGGMAIVYRAQDRKLNRPVAIKVLRPEVAAALGPERFLREISIAARLTHPHILPLNDSGEVDGVLYYVMPYIAGATLRDRLNTERQLPIDTALDITRQVASALAFAHDHDVVHRDIKPENILLAGDEVVVADFGIARALTAAGGERLTSTGIAVGTPLYMSPEQGDGEPNLDGRSDLYSLGLVLYEMLSGATPYAGPTAQAIQARRKADPVPPLRSVREALPAQVEQVIFKVLAKVPADRFATAAQFVRALGHPAEKPRGSGRQTIRWVVSFALTLAVVVVLVTRLRSGKSVTLNPNLIAVAPFNIQSAGLASWSEGLVEYLSRSLDGAGELRTISPSVFLRRWQGQADPATAAALGRRTGAGLVVFGSLIRGGLDSVRLRATLQDITTGRWASEVEIRGDTLSIDRIADSLAVSLLRDLGRTRPIAAVRNAPFGTASLPALKEFLQGERFYRQRQFDSTLAHDARAIALDSSLALAYHRMSLVLSWGPATARDYRPMETYAFKAAALNRGLAPRDSLLIAADSGLLAFFTLADQSDSISYDLRRRVFALLNDGARRFPGDPEVWIEVGEARYNMVDSPAEALQAFDRAIALDSGFTPAYEHVLQLALQTGGEELARRYAQAYLEQNRSEASSASIWLASLLLDPIHSRSPETERLIDTLGIKPLWQAGLEHLGYWVDSAETSIRLLRAVPVGRRSLTEADQWVGDTLMWTQYLASALLFRGHVHEAYQVYRPLLAHPDTNPWAWFDSPLQSLALMGALPPDTVAAVIARTLVRGEAGRGWLQWWLIQRDTAALAGALRRATRLVAQSRTSTDAARYRAVRSATAGYLALARGDSEAALRELRDLPDSSCECGREKLTFAQLLAARGDDRTAGQVLDRWVWDFSGPYLVLVRLDRARIAERTGDRVKAVREYQFVVDAWRRADPVLQHYVVEAREGLGRLGAEPR